MSSEKTPNQIKPTKKLVLPGAAIPRMTIVDTMVDAELSDISHIESVNIMSQEIQAKFPHGTVVVKPGKGFYTKYEGHTILVDKYVWLPTEAVISITFNNNFEDMKKRINLLLETPKSAQFPQMDELFINYYLIPQIRAMQLAIYAYKNQWLIEYFEKKRIEMIKFLADTDNPNNADKQLLKELTSEQQEPVIKQKNGIIITSGKSKKKPFWKRRF